MSTVGTKRSAPSHPVEKTAFGRMPAGKEPTAVVYDRSSVVTEHKFAVAKNKGIWASMMAQRDAGYYVLYDMQPVDRADLVKGGVPSRFVGSISTDMGVTKDRFVKITGLSKATINRKIANKTDLSADESERLVGLGKLIGQVESIVKESGSPEGFKAATGLRRTKITRAKDGVLLAEVFTEWVWLKMPVTRTCAAGIRYMPASEPRLAKPGSRLRSVET